MFEFRRQPLKTTYLTFFVISTVFFRLPYWLLIAIPPAWRARRTFSIKRAVILQGIRAYVGTWFDTEMPFSPGQDPELVAASDESKDVGFTWVPPISPDLVVGEVRDVAQLNNVEAKKTSGYWFKNETVVGKGNEHAGPNEAVIFYLHSGGYIMGSAHPQGGAAGPICNGLLQHCPKVSRIFSGGYRLSSSAPFPAKNAFPAALLDALASYHYLLHTVGFQAENIILCGDSAGGHLALTLLRYLTNNHLPGLPIPGTLILLSATVDWGNSHDGPFSSLRQNTSSDYCGRFFEGYTTRSLLGNLPADAANTSPWISPASLKLLQADGMFKGFPRTYIVVGDGEIALDSTRTFHNRLVSDIGKENVTYSEVKDATHDFIAMSWHEPERTNTLKEISEWLDVI